MTIPKLSFELRIYDRQKTEKNHLNIERSFDTFS